MSTPPDNLPAARPAADDITEDVVNEGLAYMQHMRRQEATVARTAARHMTDPRHDAVGAAIEAAQAMQHMRAETVRQIIRLDRADRHARDVLSRAAQPSGQPVIHQPTPGEQPGATDEDYTALTGAVIPAQTMPRYVCDNCGHSPMPEDAARLNPAADNSCPQCMAGMLRLQTAPPDGAPPEGDHLERTE